MIFGQGQGEEATANSLLPDHGDAGDERYPTAEAYRFHDDDDDGEISFMGKRAVKRSRRLRAHGWRSRRLKSAASGRHAVRQNKTMGHCCKQQLQAEERRNEQFTNGNQAAAL